MTDRTETAATRTARPAALPAALRDRLLHAMTDAAAEERADRETEALLRRLSPSPVPARLSARAGVRMCLTAVEERRGHTVATYGRKLMWHRFAAAASVLFFCVAGVLTLVTGNAAADTTQGLMSRSVLEAQAESVQWQDGAPVRSYLVTYEDEFVMDADDDMKVMVRVPNRTEVQVDEDIL